MIRYSYDLEGVNPNHLQGFFQGWQQAPDPETHLRILRNSQYIVLAIQETDGQVVGFINAISDGILSAYIPLLEVRSSYRKQGIGHELVRRMQEQLHGMYMVDLLCDPGLVPFYKPLGFESMQGMAWRNFSGQRGLDAQSNRS